MVYITYNSILQGSSRKYIHKFYLFDTSGLALLVSMNLVSTMDMKMLAKATDCHFDAYLRYSLPTNWKEFSWRTTLTLSFSGWVCTCIYLDFFLIQCLVCDVYSTMYQSPLFNYKVQYIGEQAGHMVGNYNRIACPLNKS